MSEIFEKLLYQPVRPTKTGGIPSIDFAGNKELIRAQTGTAAALQKISNFAFESASQDKQVQGAERGMLDAQTTLESFQGRDKSSFNIEERAAYNAARETMSLKMEVLARQTMGTVLFNAQNDDIDPSDLNLNLSAVVEGFSESLGSFDPVAAESFKLNMENAKNGFFLDYSEKYQKKENAKRKAEVIQGERDFKRNIEDLSKGSYVDWDSFMGAEIDRYAAYLVAGNFSAEEVARKVNAITVTANAERLRGDYRSRGTLAEKKEFLESLEDNISKTDGSKGKGLSRGLLTSEAEAVLTSLVQEYNFDSKTMTAKANAIGVSMREEIASVVKSGGVVSDEKFTAIEQRINDLEEEGLDLELTNALRKDFLNLEENTNYLRQIKKYNIEELNNEVQVLQKIFNEQATPVIKFKLTQAGQEFKQRAAELKSIKAEFQTAVDGIGDEISTIQEIVDQGEVIDTTYFESIDSLINDLEEDPKFPPGMLDDVKKNLADLKFYTNFAADFKDDNLSEIEAKLVAVQSAVEGVSDPDFDYVLPEGARLVKLQNDLRARQSAIKSGVNSDPLLWSHNSGLVDIETNLVDQILSPTGDQTEESLGASITRRKDAALATAKHYGNPIKYFTQNEADSMAQILNDPDTPTELQGAFLQRISKTFGTDSREVFKQIASNKTAGELTHIGGLIELGSSPDVIQRALVGRKIAQGMADQIYTEYTDQVEKRVELLSGLNLESSMVSPVNYIKKVAGFIYLGTDRNFKKFDRDIYADAIQSAAGRVGDNGGIVEYNDRQVIIPNNIPNDGGLEAIFDNMKTVDDIVPYAVYQPNQDGKYDKYNGKPVGAENGVDVSIDVLRSAQLITVGDGIYKLRLKSGLEIYSGNGQPYLIDLKTLGPGADNPMDYTLGM
jgi:hypothetical protein